MPTIITNASKELPVQCVSEEILWLANQSSKYQCNVYRCHYVFIVFTDILPLADCDGVALA